ncbi:MAG: hypothetical protein HDS66_01480 [Bacteroidales bacterium]|nr:hypothetical protein [Bacteroidales bacterium]
MKKTKKTYGVYNLIEWLSLLHLGKATVKVHFTGGSITTQGITPATYITADPVVQFAIECSPEFRSGKIKIVRSVTLNEEVEIERNAMKAAPDNPNPDPDITAGRGDSFIAAKEGETLEEMSDGNKEENGKSEKRLIELEFSSNDEAKDYLEQSFGLVRSKLRNREDICKAGLLNGVDIRFV